MSWKFIIAICLRCLAKRKEMLGSLPVNLENPSEGSKMNVGVRWILAKDAELTRPEKPAFSLEDFEAGVVLVNPGWLRGVWNKWPGDESIEELLAIR